MTWFENTHNIVWLLPSTKSLSLLLLYHMPLLLVSAVTLRHKKHMTTRRITSGFQRIK